MGVRLIVLVSVIIGAVAHEDPSNNSSFSLEEVKTTAEPRMLEQVQLLLQNLSDKIKLLDERVDSLLIAQNGTNEMLNTTNKSFDQVLEELNSFSSLTTQRLINIEHQLERLPEDTRVYLMQPDTSKDIMFEVSRDLMNSYGFDDTWIVFQRRFNGSVDFYRNWTEYKNGFGDLHGEHWLGLDKLHAIVKTRQHELLIVLEDFDGVFAYAHYDDFEIANENEKYMIKSVGRYTGTAGDSFTYHKSDVFSTYDQDNDHFSENCAKEWGGAWWFFKCYKSHLNGRYFTKESIRAGIIWDTFRGMSYSLKSTKMMVRPVK